MGLAASSPGPGGGGGGGGLGHSGGDIIRRCNCYSVNNLSLDRKCYRHSLTFNSAQTDKTTINPKQKKKRNYGFATFKKKLIGKRRHWKGSDHGRYFREHFVDCPSDVLRALMAQYEALMMMKDLSVQADLARPPAMSLGQSLTDLFESEECSDLILNYCGARLPVHRAILMARCPYFSRHLNFSPSGSTAELHLRTLNYTVSIPMLKRAIKYLYSGSSEVLIPSSDQCVETDQIELLQDEFGTPNSLESDMAYLLESGSLADCRLTFTSGSEGHLVQRGPELMCHRTILAARSGFFRRLIVRRLKSCPQLSSSVMDICLDGVIVPPKYGKLLLHAMYNDVLDLRLIENDVSNSADNLASLAGAAGASVTAATASADDKDDHVMNLFEIGRFLEFNFLSLSCEDILMQSLGPSNVIKILNWSSKPHGSSWISRQAFLFLEEEFYTIANSDVLASLDQDTLQKILQSDFLQASEAEILQALIRWGECQLNNRLTKDSLSSSSIGSASTLTRRRDTKRREVCESELKELLAPLFPLVRFPHILPRDKNAEVLDLVRSRNLYPVLPNFTSQISCSTKYSPWDPRCTNGWFVRPRLFVPYFEECKNLIHDRCAPDPELISSSSPCIGQIRESLHHGQRFRRKCDEPDEDEEDNAIEFQSTKPPDKEMISKMLERLKKLLNSFPVQRSLSTSFIGKPEIVHLVELRVVREFNLPDNYVNILRKMHTRNFLKESYSSSVADSRPDLFCSAGSSLADLTYRQGSDFYRPEMELSNASFPVVPSSSSSQLFCGPDVTLATNAMSALSLHYQQQPEQPRRLACNKLLNCEHDPESPDLVSIDDPTLSQSLGKHGSKHSRPKWQGRLDAMAAHGSPFTTQLQPLRRNSHSNETHLRMTRSLYCQVSSSDNPGEVDDELNTTSRQQNSSSNSISRLYL